MEEIELVIKIPENTYRQIQALARNGYFEHDICGNSMRRIANGTPLPKGHGRIVDIGSYEGKVIASRKYCGVNKLIEVAELDTIIEADRE